MADLNVAIKITGDAGDASAAVDQARAKFDQLGASAQAAMAAGRTAINGQTDAVAQLVAQIDPLAGKFAKLDEQLSALQAFKNSGAISGDDFVAYAAKIEETRAALGGAEGAAQAAGQAFSGLAMNSRVAYSASALLSDALSGQFGRSKREIAALANETGLLGSTFSTLAGPIGVVVAVVATLGAAYISAEREQSAFAQSLNVTGNYVGQTVSGLESMKDAIGSADADYSKAATALTLLAGSGKITGENLQLAAQAAVDFSNVTGETIEKSSAVIEKLAQDPEKAVVQLNDSFHFLTLTEYEHIAALQKAGDVEGAFAVATQALDAAMKQRIDQAQSDAGIFSRVWHASLTMVAEDWNTLKTLMGSIGNNSLDQQLQTELENYEALTSMLDANTAAGQRAIAVEEQKIQAIEKQIAAQNQAVQAQAAYEQIQQQGIAAETELTKFLQDHAQKSEKLSADLQILQGMLIKVAAAAAATAANKGTFQGWIDAFSQMKTLAQQATQGVADLDAQYEKHSKAVDTSAQDQKILNKVLSDAASAVDKVDSLYDQYSGSLSGPWAAAQSKYNATLKELDAAYEGIGTQLNLGVINQDQYNKKLAELITVSEMAGESLDQTNAQLQVRYDIIGKVNQEIQDQIAANESLGIQQKADLATDKEVNAALASTHDLLGQNYTDRQAQITAIQNERAALDQANVSLLQYQEAAKQAQQAMTDFGNIAKNTFDGLDTDIAKTLVEGGSFMTSLKSTAQQTVEAIIAEFLKLEFLVPFMQSIFGQVGAAMLGYSNPGIGGGVLGSLLGGGSFGGSSSILGSVVGAFGSGGSSGSSGGLLGDASSLNSLAGNPANGLLSTLWGDTQSSSLFQSVFGSTSGAGSGLMGFLFGGSGSELGGVGALSDVGALGGSSDLLGTLGIPDYAGAGLGSGISSTSGLLGSGGGMDLGAIGSTLGGAFAGWQIGSQIGGTAGGIIGAAGLGALSYMIPVVGWIAGAASLINSLTGGGLFGTSWGVTGGGQTTDITSSGANVSTFLDESKKKALFGGHSYRTVSTTTDQAAIDAANAFFDALQKGTNDFAAQFGLTVATVVGGTFTQNFDKNGKPTTTSDTVLGQTYTGETQAQFGERIQAESEIAVLNQLGVNATAYSQAFISNADNLAKAIQDLGAASLAAYTDINNGVGLLGPSGSLGDVMNEVEKLDQSGETLAAAYSRLVTESDAWKASMEAAAITAKDSATQTLEFADALSKAFGSASAMQTALTAFDKNYYTPGQLAAQQTQNDQAQLATLGAAIGQSPTETMAQFKAAFTAVESSLTPQQLAQWVNFGNLLATVTSEVATAAANYQQFMAQFGPTTSAFEQAMQKVNDTLAANIAQANDLAQANGQAGASAQDIGKIIAASVQQGVAAVQQLESEAATLSQTLFQGDLPSQITALQAKLAADQAGYKGGNQFAGLYAQQDQQQLTALQAQLAAQQAAAAKQQQFLQAAQLLGDLGQIGAVTGQGLGDFSKMFNIPLDKFASMLGTDQAGLAKEFSQQEAMAKSALETSGNTKYTAELLTDTNDILRGIAPEFSPAAIYAALTGTELAQKATGGKGTVPIGATGPGANGTAATVSPAGTSGDPVVTKNPDTTTAVNNQTPILRDIRNALRDLTTVRDRYYAPRNTRPAMVN